MLDFTGLPVLVIGAIIILGIIVWLIARSISTLYYYIRYRRSDACQISPRCCSPRGHAGICDWP
jgi:hypothetical protein